MANGTQSERLIGPARWPLAGLFQVIASGIIQLRDSLGAVQASIATTGVTFLNPIISSNGITNNAIAGAANSFRQVSLAPANIASGAATSVLRMTVPNVSVSCVFRVFIRITIGDTAAAYQSTRVVEVQIALARTAGAATVGAISSAIGAAIATVSGGATFTVAATLSSVTGGNTATQTIDLQLNATPSAGTPNMEVQLSVLQLNGVAGGVTFAAL